jgi:hypothetical protein
MKNVEMSVKGNLLIVRIGLSEEYDENQILSNLLQSV